MSSWSEYFARVPDPRRQSGLLKHLLSDILGVALCAMLCGADDFVEMEVFARERLGFLRAQLGFVLAAGAPSHDTFTRVFGHLNSHHLEQCLLDWLHLWQQEPAFGDTGQERPRHLCIDGKLARGSWHHTSQVCALSMVSVFAVEMRLMLCSGRLQGQGGENVLARNLLELLQLEGTVVTGDAAYCQKDIAHTIKEQKGDYVFVLKANHRKLYQQVQRAWEQVSQSQVAETTCGHARHEERRVQCALVEELGLAREVVAQWAGLQSVVRVERTRIIHSGQDAGTRTRNVWFYVSSLAPDQELLASTIRAHWSIENQAHWVLDVVFGEDRCRTRKEHAPYNLALLRRICLNLLRQYQGKHSLKATRKQVAWNNELLTKMLQTPLALP